MTLRPESRGASALLFAVALLALFAAPAWLAALAAVATFALVPLLGGQTASAWRSASALLGGLLAADIGFQGWRDYGALAIDFAAAPASEAHAAFHLAVAGGATLAFALLLLYLFWGPLRSGSRSALVALAIAGLVDVALLVEPVRRELGPHAYGHEHPSVWLIPLLWILTLGAAAAALRGSRSGSERQ